MKLSQTLDIFGIPFSWNNHGSQKYTSKAGFIMTILFICLSIFTITQFLIQLLNRENPYMSQSTFYDSSPKAVSITNDKLLIAFGLETPIDHIHFIDESIYSVQMTLEKHTIVVDETTGEYEKVLEEDEITVQRCSEIENFDSVLGSVADIKDVLYCMKLDEGVQIYGDWDSKNFAGIALYIRQCQNTTENGSSCSPQEEIDAKVTGASFSVYFVDSSLDPTNNSQPIQNFHNSKFLVTRYSDEFEKQWYLMLKNNELHTDYGFIFESKVVDNFVSFHSATEVTDYAAGGEGTIIYAFLQLTRERTIYNRSYDKMPQMIAQIVAILQFYIFVMMFIVTPFQEFKFYQGFVGESYGFDVDVVESNQPQNVAKIGKVIQPKLKPANCKIVIEKVNIDDNPTPTPNSEVSRAQREYPITNELPPQNQKDNNALIVVKDLENESTTVPPLSDGQAKKDIECCQVCENLNDLYADRKTKNLKACSLSLADYYASIFCSKRARAKRQIFEEGKKELNMVLDVVSYFQLKKEIDLLKKLLLSLDEQTRFQSLIDQKIDISKKLLNISQQK